MCNQLQTIALCDSSSFYVVACLLRLAKSVAAGQGGGGDLWEPSRSQRPARVECVRVRAHTSDTASQQSTQQCHHNRPTLLWYTCIFVLKPLEVLYR